MKQNLYSDFYRDKRVLVTGHTGFKGTWLTLILKELGANVTGYALRPPTEPSLFALTEMASGMRSVEGDIRDFEHLMQVFAQVQPEIVIHMAAQPLVRESYVNPILTYETNVSGTVNLLECVRKTPSVRSVVNVTTDKVYRNNEWESGYVETDVLDGYDPYSNSKSCSELVTHSYVQSFLKEQGVAVSTCRAGNVLGGGDFAKDRILPDCIRAVFAGEAVTIRNPNSTRPYQHVLEPLFVYLMVAMRQFERLEYADCYNVGPDEGNNVTTGILVDRFCHYWGEGAGYHILSDHGPHEASFLKLDCTKLKQTFLWSPCWTIDETLLRVVDFEKRRLRLQEDGSSAKRTAEVLTDCMRAQTEDYLAAQEK